MIAHGEPDSFDPSIHEGSLARSRVYDHWQSTAQLVAATKAAASFAVLPVPPRLLHLLSAQCAQECTVG
eukprot:2186974-Pleurochrysis_carterae.AAC.2